MSVYTREELERMHFGELGDICDKLGVTHHGGPSDAPGWWELWAKLGTLTLSAAYRDLILRYQACQQPAKETST